MSTRLEQYIVLGPEVARGWSTVASTLNTHLSVLSDVKCCFTRPQPRRRPSTCTSHYCAKNSTPSAALKH